jgi:hypothetical protein
LPNHHQHCGSWCLYFLKSTKTSQSPDPDAVGGRRSAAVCPTSAVTHSSDSTPPIAQAKVEVSSNTSSPDDRGPCQSSRYFKSLQTSNSATFCMAAIPYFTLNDGSKIPSVGMG